MQQLKEKNIPINNKLLNKYDNITELINNNMNINKVEIKIRENIKELKNSSIEDLNIKDATLIAKYIFHKYNNRIEFINDENIILVSNADIKESINKIFSKPKQKKYILEHLNIFSVLGTIIETSTLEAQIIDKKKRKNNNLWSYYINKIKINGKYYLFEFDVVSRQDGENHYRVQRLQEINEKNEYLS